MAAGAAGAAAIQDVDQVYSPQSPLLVGQRWQLGIPLECRVAFPLARAKLVDAYAGED